MQPSVTSCPAWSTDTLHSAASEPYRYLREAVTLGLLVENKKVYFYVALLVGATHNTNHDRLGYPYDFTYI